MKKLRDIVNSQSAEISRLHAQIEALKSALERQVDKDMFCRVVNAFSELVPPQTLVRVLLGTEKREEEK